MFDGSVNVVDEEWCRVSINKTEQGQDIVGHGIAKHGKGSDGRRKKVEDERWCRGEGDEAWEFFYFKWVFTMARLL